MAVTLLLPGALLPREVVHALRDPLARSGLATLLERAELCGDSEAEEPAHLAWLAERLLGEAAPLATAPYAWASLTGKPSGAFLWHADPVHLELARDHLVVTPLAAAPSADERAALLHAANQLTADAGARFVAAHDHWFLQADRAWDLQTVPLAAVVGRPLHAALPAGTDAPLWNRLLTEIQMAWHMLPVNDAREARGDATVNSVWLHGGGAWTPLAPGGFSAVLADAPEWRGAAEAAALPAEPADAAPREGALVVWSELLAPRALQDWDAWLGALRAIDGRLANLPRAGAVDLVLAGDRVVRRMRARPNDRMKFWRSRSLELALAE